MHTKEVKREFFGSFETKINDVKKCQIITKVHRMYMTASNNIKSLIPFSHDSP